MNKTIFFLLFVLPILYACNGHQHHGKPGIVELDNGKRWKANPETTSGIAGMQAIMVRYEGKTTDATVRKALRGELEASFQGIFEQCTMTGEAHTQLHNYLLPMKALFDKIENGNATESSEAIDQLKKHLAEYQTYFE